MTRLTARETRSTSQKPYTRPGVKFYERVYRFPNVEVSVSVFVHFNGASFNLICYAPSDLVLVARRTLELRLPRARALIVVLECRDLKSTHVEVLSMSLNHGRLRAATWVAESAGSSGLTGQSGREPRTEFFKKPGHQ